AGEQEQDHAEHGHSVAEEREAEGEDEQAGAVAWLGGLQFHFLRSGHIACSVGLSPRHTKTGPFSSAMPQGWKCAPASSTVAQSRSRLSRSSWSTIRMSPLKSPGPHRK